MRVNISLSKRNAHENSRPCLPRGIFHGAQIPKFSRRISRREPLPWDCVAGTTFVSAKGAFSGELGKARRDRDAWTAWKQNCTAKHASSFFAHSLTATPYHLLPLWTGTSSRDSVKKRQGRFRDACPKAHCDTQKRPAARQDVSLREISAGGESALLPEPAADFQTGFFPDWPRSARPSARSPSDCSGRSGSRKSCRGRRPAQGRAP